MRARPVSPTRLTNRWYQNRFLIFIGLLSLIIVTGLINEIFWVRKNASLSNSGSMRHFIRPKPIVHEDTKSVNKEDISRMRTEGNLKTAPLKDVQASYSLPGDISGEFSISAVRNSTGGYLRNLTAAHYDTIVSLQHGRLTSVTELHALAKDGDRLRPWLPENLLSSLGLPPVREIAQFQNSRSLADWVPKVGRNQRRAYASKVCTKQSATYVRQVPGMTKVEKVTDSFRLVQRSFVVKNVGYDIMDSQSFSDKAKLLSEPFCDLRKCDQSKFPFIYFNIPNRNRVANAKRLISSFRNVTTQCPQSPPWLDCVCCYVTDYGSINNEALVSSLQNEWPGHIRLLSRQNVTETWSKARTLNWGIQTIPTPSRRSLVFNVDADLIVESASFVDLGLRRTKAGESVAFPAVMGTRPSITDLTSFYQRAINNTLLKKEHSWKRNGGFGMTWFYVYDNPVGLMGKYVYSKKHGMEDVEFYTVFKRLAITGDTTPLRRKSKSPKQKPSAKQNPQVKAAPVSEPFTPKTGFKASKLAAATSARLRQANELLKSRIYKSTANWNYKVAAMQRQLRKPNQARKLGVLPVKARAKPKLRFPRRYQDFSLWHIAHPHNLNWHNSTDGMTAQDAENPNIF